MKKTFGGCEEQQSGGSVRKRTQRQQFGRVFGRGGGRGGLPGCLQQLRTTETTTLLGLCRGSRRLIFGFFLSAVLWLAGAYHN